MSRLLPIKLAGEPLCDPGFLGHRKLLTSVGGVLRFSVDFFGLTVLNNFVGNNFNLPELFGYRNFPCLRTENHVLPSKNFVSQFAKKSWESLLSFRKLGISETFIRITVFLRFFLSHSTEKLREEPSKVSKSFKCEVTKNNLNENGILRFSVENFFGSECRKISLWNTSVYQKSSAIEKFQA